MNTQEDQTETAQDEVSQDAGVADAATEEQQPFGAPQYLTGDELIAYGQRYAQDAINDQIEIDQVIATVENLIVSTEAALAADGLSPQAAEMANQLFESQAARVGLGTETFSLESFGGSKTRLEATREFVAKLRNGMESLVSARAQVTKRIEDTRSALDRLVTPQTT